MMLIRQASPIKRGFNIKFLRHLTTGGDQIKNVTIVGGGLMGSGIADNAARHGFNVTVVDSDEYAQKCMVTIIKSLNRATKKRFPDEPKSAKKYVDDVLKNIKTQQHIDEGCSNADLVIESVIENQAVKCKILKKIDEATPKHAVIASNTSSLRLAELSEELVNPERFGGLHFFNPVWKMQLVEVARSAKTSDKTFGTLQKYAKDVGKTVVTCDDISGLIVNRLLIPYLVEALNLLERGHATVDDIDTAMKLGAGYPLGPFEVIDRIGLDTVKMIIDGWHQKEPENPLFQPSKTLDNLVAEQKLGKKSLQGFYKYKHTLF